MKKLFILLFIGSVLPVSAETVSMVSYNPSRLGQYDQLKVTDRVVFLNGLTVTNLLRVTKTATLEWNNTTATHTLNTLSGRGTVDMPASIFVSPNETSTLTNYKAQNALTLTGANKLSFSMAGGSASFVNDSFVSNVVADAYLRMYSGSVNAGMMSIQGDSGPQLINSSHAKDWETDGFYLAGGDIPKAGFSPAAGQVLSWKTRSACKGNATTCTNSNRLSVQLLGYN